MATVGHPEAGLEEAGPWWTWGPYLSERAWGTVREDYSADGDAWGYFPHDHARSRAYRWNEDGLAGLSTLRQDLCLALALWNGGDPILKERIFGLAGPEGNHGEDAKEYWWYLDATPSHSWLRWRYHYPQRAFPYDDLVAENGRRDRDEPRVRAARHRHLRRRPLLVGRGDVRQGRAHRRPHADRRHQRGPGRRRLHVLPTCGSATPGRGARRDARPPAEPSAAARTATCSPSTSGPASTGWRPRPARTAPRPTPLFCDNETNAERLFGAPSTTPYPKDGINDHVVDGGRTVNPAPTGTKAAWWYRLRRPGRGDRELRLRLCSPTAGDEPDPAGPGRAFDADASTRAAEADEFYADLTPPGTSAGARGASMRPAFAGMVWGKQFYRYDVPLWLDGDPGEPPPPPGHAHGRNARWRHFDAVRHPVDARPVGVPVVRRVGPRVPHGDARAHRPGVREVPARAAVPRVVHAPQRRAAGVRVVVRRREPAGARVGGAEGVPDRRGGSGTPTTPSSSGSSRSCC